MHEKYVNNLFPVLCCCRFELIREIIYIKVHINAIKIYFHNFNLSKDDSYLYL